MIVTGNGYAIERGVDELVDELLCPWAYPFDHARCERHLHQTAQPRVVGWVHEQHRLEAVDRGLATFGARLFEELLVEVRVVLVTRVARVAQHRRRIGVRREEPQSEVGA
jgi:hypothetical protein